MSFPLRAEWKLQGAEYGKIETKSTAIEEIKLNLTSKADGRMMIRKKIWISKLLSISITV